MFLQQFLELEGAQLAIVKIVSVSDTETETETIDTETILTIASCAPSSSKRC